MIADARCCKTNSCRCCCYPTPAPAWHLPTLASPSRGCASPAQPSMRARARRLPAAAAARSGGQRLWVQAPAGGTTPGGCRRTGAPEPTCCRGRCATGTAACHPAAGQVLLKVRSERMSAKSGTGRSGLQWTRSPVPAMDRGSSTRLCLRGACLLLCEPELPPWRCSRSSSRQPGRKWVLAGVLVGAAGTACRAFSPCRRCRTC